MFFLFLLSITNLSFAETYVSGVISSNTTWTLANSPYIVTGSVAVPSGVTLTIEAGVQVKFNRETYLKVEGSLIAQGTQNNPIVFTSNQTNPASGDWAGIRIRETGGTTFISPDSETYSSGSILNHVKVEYATTGIYIYNTGLLVTNSEFYKNNTAIELRKSSHTVFINNTFKDNSKGIYSIYEIYTGDVYGDIVNAKINNNSFSGGTYGINLTLNQRDFRAIYIDNNEFSNVAIAIKMGGGGFGPKAHSIYITRNKVYNASTGILCSTFHSPAKGSVPEYQVVISSNIIKNSAGNGLTIEWAGVWADIKYLVAYNEIVNNTYGVSIYGRNSAGSVFKNNNIINNGYGIKIDGTSSYYPSNWIIHKNLFGKNTGTSIEVIYGSGYQITYNNFIGNTGIYEIENKTANNIIADNNYWGTTSTSEVTGKIYDYFDNFECGKVLYDPIQNSPIENNRPSIPLKLYVTNVSVKNYVGSTSLNFAWEEAVDDIGVTGYNVYVSSDNNPYGSANFTTNTNFTVTGVDGHSYKIKVEALDSIGAGLPLESETYIIDLTPPQAVTTLVATTQSNGDIKLTWAVVTDTGVGTSYYNIYRSTISGSLGAKISMDGLVTTGNYIDSGTNLSDGTTYYYTVRAVDRVGNEQILGNNQASAISDSSAYAPAVNSTSHPDQNVWYTIDIATFTWIPPTDVSGIAGYYFNFTNAISTPNPATDNFTTNTSTTIIGIPDGIWYFNIISKYNVGNYGTTVSHYRVRVDKSPPSAPGIPQDDGVYSGTTTITCRWAPATDPETGIAGYYICVGTTPGGSEIINDFWVGNTTSYTITNLEDKFTYYVKVKAKNNVGLVGNYSLPSDGVKIDLSPPQAPLVVRDGIGEDIDTTFSTIQLSANWDAGSDADSGIKGYWYAIGTTPGGSDVRNWTYIGNVLNVTLSGLNLSVGTTYYFSIRAENGAGLLSDVVSSDGINIRSSILHHYEVIAPSEVTAGTNFTITINAKNVTNDTFPNYTGNVTLQAVLARNEDFIGTGVLGVVSANLVNGTVTINHQTYTKAEDIKIKVIDANGVTGLSNIISVSAGVPSNLEVSANPGSIISGQSSLVTAVITDIYGNPVTNRLVNFKVIKGSGTLSALSATTDNRGKATVVFTQNLVQAEVNTILVTVGNLSAQVNINVAVLISAGAGGTIVASEDPNTKVTIPPNAIISDVQILIRMLNDLTQEEINKINEANKKVYFGKIVSTIVRAFHALKTDGSEYGSFADFVTVEIPYLDNNDDGIVDGTNISVDELKMLRLNENTNKWEVVADGGINTVDKTKKVVKAEVKHFSIYTLGSPLASDLNNVVVYPNPVNFSKAVKGRVKFEGLTKNAKIQIFDITGRLVKILNPGTPENDGVSGKAEWDGKNGDGEDVGMGLYIYFITDEEGHKKTGKIAVTK